MVSDRILQWCNPNTKEYNMKSNKEYHFQNRIEDVSDVVYKLRDAGYSVSYYRKCGLDGKTICHRLVFNDLEREYEVADLDDCLKFIVNDAVMLGEMIKICAIAESESLRPNNCFSARSGDLYFLCINSWHVLQSSKNLFCARLSY